VKKKRNHGGEEKEAAEKEALSAASCGNGTC
jgi:hypothetical protein